MYLNFRKDAKCCICGAIDLYMGNIREFYLIHENSCICEKCGKVADKFITGYRSKSPNKVSELNQFVNSGIDAQRKFSQQMNGGYNARN